LDTHCSHTSYFGAQPPQLLAQAVAYPLIASSSFAALEILERRESESVTLTESGGERRPCDWRWEVATVVSPPALFELAAEELAPEPDLSGPFPDWGGPPRLRGMHL
jgi:hypothetical protein